jgi:hypothetical protein
MSLRYIYGREAPAVLDFITKRAPHMRRELWPANTMTLAVLDENDFLIAGIAWHYYNREQGTIHLSSAARSPRFGTLETIWRAYSYPFNELKCQQVLHLTPYRNNRAVDILKRLGCWYQPFPRAFGRYRDGVMLGLTEETWRQRWENRYVRSLRRHAHAA